MSVKTNRIQTLVKTTLMVIALTLLGYINLKPYTYRSLDNHQEIISTSISQLDFIKDKLKHGSAERMQSVFPEGYFFSYALYGLAWIELSLKEKKYQDIALVEALWAYEKLSVEKAKAPFRKASKLPYGVFYAGWKNWLLGGILKVQTKKSVDPKLKAEFKDQCRELAKAFRDSATPFLSAYPGLSWPVDSSIAVASLVLHDKLFENTYDELISQWKNNSKRKLDSFYGLLPHRSDSTTGMGVGGPRGSSQALTLRFLAEIDPDLFHSSYKIFRDNFVNTKLGMSGILEYPRGVSGAGDVDSGPLLFGLSPSATVVGLASATITKDNALRDALNRSIEIIGLPIEMSSKRRYGFGLLPVADAFLAWSRMAQPWNFPEIAKNNQKQNHYSEIKNQSAAVIHLLSLVCLALMNRVFYRKQ